MMKCLPVSCCSSNASNDFVPGLSKPSVVVRPNPVLFQLPESSQEESKENPSALPYRSVFAVLTLDSVLLYDTHHDQPLAVARGLHYTGLTDCCWSQDGLHLMVCSTDGYISILSFQEGELGKVYKYPAVPCMPVEAAPTTSDVNRTKDAASQSTPIVLPEDLPNIPPCQPGQAAVLEAPPTKRAKIRVTPTFISAVVDPGTTHITSAAKRSLFVETDQVGEAVNKLSLDISTTTLEPATEIVSSDDKPVKKKKRIQPLLVSK